MDNPLSKLALDYWYQVLMVVSVAVFLLTGAGVLKAFPTAATALISLGGFWIGLGEWINHPLQTSFLSPNVYRPSGVLTSHPRQSKPIGIIFLLLGLILVAFGLFRLFR
jgi:hypothetical protein